MGSALPDKGILGLGKKNPCNDGARSEAETSTINFQIGDVTGFEWDDEKNITNRQKHKIDFDEALTIFYGLMIVRPSDRNNEKRWTAIGRSGSVVIAVSFTRRGKNIRIISARRARKNEERNYCHAEMGRPAEGQD